MKRRLLIAIATTGVLLLFAPLAREPLQPEPSIPEPVKATFLITGLHCPPCTRTLEASLGRVKGVRSIKVDWTSKNARVEFDEAVVPAQKLAQAIAATPHMMGANLHYAGWLSLKISALSNAETAKPAIAVLEKVAGVKRVVAYAAQHAVAVQFTGDGAITSEQLVAALAAAEIQATNF